MRELDEVGIHECLSFPDRNTGEREIRCEPSEPKRKSSMGSRDVSEGSRVTRGNGKELRGKGGSATCLKNFGS